MDFSKFLLFVALPVMLGSSFIEALILSYRKNHDWRELGVSVFDYALRSALPRLIPFSIAFPVLGLASHYKVGHIEMNSWVAFFALFIGQEFFYYWHHRATHRVRWFWCDHSVHHTPNRLTLSAAYRQGPLSGMNGGFLFYIPLVLIGFPVQTVFQVLTLNLLYQFWIHTTWIPKLGPLEYIFNTPSAHRVHHASNLNYLDANYGGVLIIFDRLFGTYREERAEEPCIYGLVTPVTNFNPLRVEFQQWINLGKDLLSARSPRAFFGYLLKPPGWRPDGPGTTTEELRRQAGISSASLQTQSVSHRGKVDEGAEQGVEFLEVGDDPAIALKPSE